MRQMLSLQHEANVILAECLYGWKGAGASPGAAAPVHTHALNKTCSAAECEQPALKGAGELQGPKRVLHLLDRSATGRSKEVPEAQF